MRRLFLVLIPLLLLGLVLQEAEAQMRVAKLVEESGQLLVKYTVKVTLPADMVKTEQFTVEVPYKVKLEDGRIETRTRTETRTRQVLWVWEERTSAVPNRAQFTRVSGASVSQDQIAGMGKPVWIIQLTAGDTPDVNFKEVLKPEVIVMSEPK